MKKRKKIDKLFVIFCASILACLSLFVFYPKKQDVAADGDWSQVSAVKPTSGTGSIFKPYQIATVPNFIWMVQNGNGDYGYYKITENLDFSGRTWDVSNTFNGSLNGNWKVLFGLSLTCPFFSTIQNGSTVYNLMIYKAYYNSIKSGESKVAYIAGVNKGTIRDVNAIHSNIGVTVPESNGETYVGTIAGENQGTIQKISVHGDVYAYPSSTKDIPTNVTYTGGICGYNSGTIKYCKYSGKIFVGSLTYATKIATHFFGGIAGFANGSIDNCFVYNSSISGTDEKTNRLTETKYYVNITYYKDPWIGFDTMSFSVKEEIKVEYYSFVSGIANELQDSSTYVTNCAVSNTEVWGRAGNEVSSNIHSTDGIISNSNSIDGRHVSDYLPQASVTSGFVPITEENYNALYNITPVYDGYSTKNNPYGPFSTSVGSGSNKTTLSGLPTSLPSGFSSSVWGCSSLYEGNLYFRDWYW